MIGQWKQKVLERERERKEEGETSRGKLKTRRWKGNGTEARGLEKCQVIRDHIAGEQCSGKSAQFRCPAYIHINCVVFSLHGLMGLGALLQQIGAHHIDWNSTNLR